MFKCIVVIFILFFSEGGNLQTGIALYNARSVNAKGLQADAKNIDKALAIFEAELTDGKEPEKAGYYYLASLNFKGQFVYLNSSDKKNTYQKAIEKGNKLVKQFPKNAGLRFELITSIGLLAEINGVLKSAESGVLNQMLFHSKMLIETDSMYRSGAGWKVLAILNYKTPNVPFLITWPSKEEAKRLLQKALKHYPADISNNFYYAEALLENEEKADAKIYFQLAVKLPSGKEFYLEDESQKEKAKNYLLKWK